MPESQPISVLLTEAGPTDAWEPCLRSLALSGHALEIHVLVGLADPRAEWREFPGDVADIVAADPSEAVTELSGVASAETAVARPVLVITRPVVVPTGFLEAALAIVDRDPRVATVSMWTNDAGVLSFPHRNTPSIHQVEDLDEESVTRRLRELSPSVLPAPVALPVGPMAFIAGPALDALGEVPAASSGEALIARVSTEAQRKGFVSVVDPSTFYLAPSDIGLQIGPLDRLAAAGIEDLGNLQALYDEEEVSHSSPLAVAHQVSRAKALGLRVGIDGTCLGPKEMGTQVQTLHIIRALADHDDVREVTVALSGPIPRYAQETLTHTKVRVAGSHEDDMSDIGAVDVLHRPFQPQRRLDIEAWRKSSPRIMVSILDLIGYRNAAYHDSPQTWLLYRDAVRTTIEKVDGVSVISADVKDQMLLDRMPIDSERIFVAELGTDHMTGAEAERIPTELVRRGFGNDEFVLVLGATYAHKNRDQAVRAVQELRAAGRELSLVMVGAAVPQGSSRRAEAVALGDQPAPWLFTMPDVSAEERNWLLRHAVAVLYPTSAEGFGFIPFEAARMGTPTLCVPFGPLSELAPDLPVSPASWSAQALADAVEEVTSDPQTGRSQVRAVLAAGGQFTWRNTADRLVNSYRELLARPRR